MSATDPEQEELSLTPFLHQSMKYPEKSGFRYKAEAIRIRGGRTVEDLMDLFESLFKKASAGMLIMELSVLWNIKKPRTALKPSDKLCNYFQSGDTFGIYGDITLPDFLVGTRYKVGDRVLCRTGDEEWDAGTIIALHYRANNWPLGHTVPYLVELDEGDTTIVPQDIDYLCVKIVPPWWEKPLSNLPERGMAKPELSVAFQAACPSKEKIDDCDHKEETALLAAIALNWKEGVEVLLEMKADVNAIGKKEMSALHRGWPHGPSMIRLLLEAKASPNHQDIDPDFDPAFSSKTFGDHPEHRTPLHYCCVEGELESAKLLVQNGADLNIQDGQRKTPLHLAIEEDQVDLIDFLLESKAAVDSCSLESGMKNTPLMDAAHKGKLALAEKLIAARADVNKVGKQDMTALHLAARRGDPKIVKILLEAKADSTLESKSGTAMQLASKKGSAELSQLLALP